MEQLNCGEPNDNQSKTVLKPAFGQRTYADNEEFKSIIPKLCLADLFLIEYCQDGQWRESIKIFDANKRVYSCNICNIICLNAEKLIEHLKENAHEINIIDLEKTKHYNYYHPVFFQSDHPKSIDEKPRLKFLYAQVAAKIVEDEMISKGISPWKYSIGFSGKKIVETATKEEFDEVAKKFISDKLRNLEELKEEYKVMLDQLEESGDKYVEIFNEYRRRSESLYK